MIYKKLHPLMMAVCRVLACTFAVVILVASLSPAQPHLNITHADKFMHVFAYFALGAVAFPAFSRMKPLMVWGGICVFGCLIEVAQGLLGTGRTADIFDGFSNGFGALLALGGWMFVSVIVHHLHRNTEKFG